MFPVLYVCKVYFKCVYMTVCVRVCNWVWLIPVLMLCVCARVRVCVCVCERAIVCVCDKDFMSMSDLGLLWIYSPKNQFEWDIYFTN